MRLTFGGEASAVRTLCTGIDVLDVLDRCEIAHMPSIYMQLPSPTFESHRSHDDEAGRSPPARSGLP
eukprot:COSAG05_NODE_1218_length_5483_cov_330.229569_6_plen_66_part_01